MFLVWLLTAFLDYFLIYSDSLKTHRGHIQSLLEALSKAKLHLKAEKCEFHKQEVKYLRLIVGKYKVNIDLNKVAAIMRWELLECIFDIRLF